MKLIKRYRNRRFYDPDASKVVTQSDLVEMVRKGEEIQVIDTATDKDVTLAVLSRLMLAETSSWDDITKSRELLNEIISRGGDKSMSILKNTILASIGALHVTKEKAEKIIDDLIKRGELDKSDRKSAVMELLEKAEKSTSEFGKKVGKEAGKAKDEVAKVIKDFKLAKESDFNKLEKKVDKLTKLMTKLDKKLDGLVEKDG